MSRLHLRDDQIQCLDRPTLSSLHDEINEELCILADVERSIYKRRRVLDIEDDPSLLEEKYTPIIRTQKPKRKPLTSKELLKAIEDCGITPEQFKKVIGVTD